MSEQNETPFKRFLPLLTTSATASAPPTMPSASLSDRTNLPHSPPRTAYHSQPPTGVLTPPTTPEKDDMERKRSSVSIDSRRLVEEPTEQLKAMLSVGVGLGVNPTEMVGKWIENGQDIGPLRQVPETAKPYNKQYKLVSELDHGAWSTVYNATEKNDPISAHSSSLPTPPSTPEKRSSGITPGQMLAVKVLSRRDGKQVLGREARILTYLHSHTHSRRYLVPFHGFDSSRTSIIMSAVPLNLETHAKSAGKWPLSTSTMFDPVVGAAQWSHLATALIEGLSFLKSKGCVHGDIKPANILLRESEAYGDETLAPLYCDFSSSHVLTPSDKTTVVEEINAVTTDYTAPELLHALRHTNKLSGGERATATFVSDVFALGVTLLFAATGESPYCGAQMELQKASMASEGRPLDFARSGNQASRVMEGGAVDAMLKGALQKDPASRFDVERWEAVAGSITQDWKLRDWKNGGRTY